MTVTVKVCSFPGCGARVYEYGLCRGHYAQRALGQELRPKRPQVRVKECLFEGCSVKPFRRGLCRSHFEQQRRGLALRPIRAYAVIGCSFPGCDKPHQAKGYCQGHWLQAQRGVELSPLTARRQLCSMPGCGKPHLSRGFCRSHYTKSRMVAEPGFKLRVNLSRRIGRAVSKSNKSAKTMELVGCTLSELKTHLESLFTVGMSWDNYGKWQIDHILPCTTFDLLDPKQQRECFHYTNLQPLWAADNHRKSDRSPEEWAKISGGSAQ